MKAHLLFFSVSLGVLACHPPTPTASTIHVASEPPLTKLVGEGRIASPADFVELTVHLQSECHATPAAASAATDKAAAKVMDHLRSAIDPAREGDGIVASGGFTEPFERYVSSGRRICQGTFAKRSSLIMKSSRVAEFPAIYRQLQLSIFSSTLQKPAGGSSSPTTFATLETPALRLDHQTREKLEREALGLAVTSARQKFETAAGSMCKSAQPRLVKFVERNASVGRPIAYGAASQKAAPGSAIEFDQIWVNKLLDVYFELDEAACRQR